MARSEVESLCEALLFDLGKQILGKSAGGMITKLMKARGIDGARIVLKMAADKSDPREYVAAAMREKTTQNGAQIGEIIGAGKWARRWDGSKWAEVE